MNLLINFLGISGSLRKGSFNSMLLNNAMKFLPEGVDMHIISIADIPIYNGDLDIPDMQRRPEQVERLRTSILNADALVIVSPEYNYSIPGGLKNAIDWASRGADAPILNKPVALMGATTGLWGTARMQLAFLPLFLTLSIKSVQKHFRIFRFSCKCATEKRI